MEVAADISAIGKYHNAIYVISNQNIIQQGKFFTGCGDINFLFNCVCRHSLGCNLNSNGLISPGLR